MTPDGQGLRKAVEANQELLLTTLEDLIRMRSVNRSPRGEEGECQHYLTQRLQQAGYAVDQYSPDEVPQLAAHPLRTPDRTYPDRQNVSTVRKGAGGGRSLILSGHVDTVPAGTLPWTREPFTPERVGDRIYGRGSNDMKAGIAINLFMLQMLDRLGIKLKGDLTVESVVDEEFGGVNGTLAARLRDSVADAAVITEPSSLRICPAQRGGRTMHLLFTAAGGVLDGVVRAGVVAQLKSFMDALPVFAEQRRRNCKVHPLYRHCSDPVPVAITKITTGPWGTGEPITIPEEGRVELYWQFMPGEHEEDADEEFRVWLDRFVTSAPEVFAQPPTVTMAVRWLPGSAIPGDAPLCIELANAAEEINGVCPPIQGIEAPCDMFVFHHFGIPAVLWGPAGGNTHGSDEFVTISSTLQAAAALLLFVCHWCGVVEEVPA